MKPVNHMQNLLIQLFEVTKPNGLEQAFTSFEPFGIKEANDIEKLNEEDTFNLGGNITIDFHDNFDYESQEQDTFYYNHIRPIEIAYNKYQE